VDDNADPGQSQPGAVNESEDDGGDSPDMTFTLLIQAPTLPPVVAEPPPPEPHPVPIPQEATALVLVREPVVKDLPMPQLPPIAEQHPSETDLPSLPEEGAGAAPSRSNTPGLAERSEITAVAGREHVADSKELRPLVGGLLGDILPLDVGRLEQGLQRFVEDVRSLGEQAAPLPVRESNLGSWVVAALVMGAATVEVTRRYVRWRAVDLLLASPDEGSHSAWLPGLTAPLSRSKP
jgi:hypothetical protein